SFPLGTVEFTKASDLSAALPKDGFFAAAEVYHADESARFVGIRDCKGNANSTDPKTISCTVGGTVGVGGGGSLALFNFPGNWSGAAGHTINPKSGSNPFDISTPGTNLFASIHPETVTASAEGGTPVSATGCNP